MCYDDSWGRNILVDFDTQWKKYCVVIYENTFGPRHDKTNKVSEPPAKTHAQADLSLRWAHTHFVGLSCRGSLYILNSRLVFFFTNSS